MIASLNAEGRTYAIYYNNSRQSRRLFFHIEDNIMTKDDLQPPIIKWRRKPLTRWQWIAIFVERIIT